MALSPFHIAFPVDDLAAARTFYGTTLGCEEGRSSDTWIDFSLFGHQIVAHLKHGAAGAVHHNPVDGHDVPVPHFGVVLPMEEWHALAGLKKVTTEQRETFLRPRQELPFLKPIDTIKLPMDKPELPALATRERIEFGDRVTVNSRFRSDDSPAWVVRSSADMK